MPPHHARPYGRVPSPPLPSDHWPSQRFESMNMLQSSGILSYRTALALVLGLLCSGCAETPLGGRDRGEGTDGVKIEQRDPVTSGGSAKAVLSLHKKFAYENTCKFGLTLTNNLPYKITNISFRFGAKLRDDVLYRQVTRNFFEIAPTSRQYREITFSEITCDKIAWIEVTDPGRCSMGPLTRFTSQSGDCMRHVYIADTPYVRLVQK